MSRARVVLAQSLTEVGSRRRPSAIGPREIVNTTTQILAHRGASKAERENTVAAFRRAAEMGAESVELDVRRTADDVLVVHHNPVLDDGRVISQLTKSDLPSHIPTLDEALDACTPMWVNVEIKNDPSEPDFDVDEVIADRTIECLSARHEGDARWLISSFRRETIDRCHSLRPSIATAWLTLGVRPDDFDEVLGGLARDGHSALHPYVGYVTRELLGECHSRGLRVNTWTCDDPDRMAELIDWGVDGICTNVPDVALSVRDAAE